MRILVFGLGLLLLACGGSVVPGPKADSPLVVHEGLPHPEMEAALFGQEKARATASVHWADDLFYAKPLTVAPGDLTTLRTILGDKGTYQSFSSEKKCGGFHADYAVAWGAGAHRALLCFGYREVKVITGGKTTRYDLGEAQYERLEATLRPYRQSRPAR